MPSADAIRLGADDTVVVLPHGGKIGDEVEGHALISDIPAGHKAAARDVPLGGTIIKYGHPIGRATAEIKRGEWVHEHNVSTRLADGDVFPSWGGAPAKIEIDSRGKTFRGWRRAHGRPGVRNELWIIPSVGCVSGEIRALASKWSKPPHIDAVRVLDHPFGCSQLGDDLTMTEALLSGIARNPNAAGVVFAGLGCENLSVDRIIERAAIGDRGRRVVLQEDDEDKLCAMLDELADSSPREREELSVADLCIAVKCGGSDGYSGITANPLVGRCADAIASFGGAVIAGEIPEMFGAEEVIASKAATEDVWRSFVATNEWYREYYRRHEQPIFENPSPGNRAGGITTLEEKSLGAVEKMGSTPIVDVLEYGELARKQGVNIAFSPGNDLVSCTAMAAAGAQMILFTTGRGTPFGTVVPTVKISTNTPLAERRPSWIDFDAGTILSGESIDDATERLVGFVIETASGRRTKNEEKDACGIAIFKDGVTL